MAKSPKQAEVEPKALQPGDVVMLKYGSAPVMVISSIDRLTCEAHCFWAQPVDDSGTRHDIKSAVIGLHALKLN